jgi:hypothetical protein
MSFLFIYTNYCNFEITNSIAEISNTFSLPRFFKKVSPLVFNSFISYPDLITASLNK